jgi:hypothetical protein
MRIAILAALAAVTLSATGLGALTIGRQVPHFSGVPVRTHTTLGPVRVLAWPEADAAPVPLAVAARAHYGRIDALAHVRTEPLPWSDAALITGVAIRWD